MSSYVEEVAGAAGTQVTRLRWAIGINGALAVAFGLAILIWPDISLYALTILFGAYVTAAGVVGIAAVFGGAVRQERSWLALTSILNVIVGIAILVWPSISALA